MARTRRLRTILSQYYKISNEEVSVMIGGGRVRVNGKTASPATNVEAHEEIAVDGKIIREAIQFTYIKFYKPRGIECTLNTEIANNLLSVFHYPKKLFPVGRLDKESEGLLLMTDDGELYRNIAWTESEKEKEYVVTVDKPVDEDFFQRMREGIIIMGKRTKPAKVFPVAENKFRIILTQGLNRQIRRMCYKLGYEVKELIRTRIDKIELGNMEPGESETSVPPELF